MPAKEIIDTPTLKIFKLSTKILSRSIRLWKIINTFKLSNKQKQKELCICLDSILEIFQNAILIAKKDCDPKIGYRLFS